MKSDKLDFTGQAIFIGIDVHKKRWVISIFFNGREHKTYSQDPSVKLLKKYLEKNFPGANYYSVYEAGFSGYWIHRRLIDIGIKNIIVNPADIPTSNKDSVRKTDFIDSRKLAKVLTNSQVTGIYVPEEKTDYDRRLMRLRVGMVRKMTRVKNQIKGLLSLYGIEIKEEMIRRYWSLKYINGLSELSQNIPLSLGISLKFLIKELMELRQIKLELYREIKKLSESNRYKMDCTNLTSIPGISTISAMTLLTEIGEIKRFKKFDKLCSYVGLTPDEHSSGDKIRIGRITNRRNGYLRGMLTEISWTAIRLDPALMLKFKEFSSKMLKSKAIIKIARKILNRIKYVLVNKEKYELGVVE